MIIISLLQVILLLYTRGLQAQGVRVYISAKSWCSSGISDIYLFNTNTDRWWVHTCPVFLYIHQYLMINSGFKAWASATQNFIHKLAFTTPPWCSFFTLCTALSQLIVLLRPYIGTLRCAVPLQHNCSHTSDFVN